MRNLHKNRVQSPKEHFTPPTWPPWRYVNTLYKLVSQKKRCVKGSSALHRELKQPRRQPKRKPHKFAYLTMKNSIFARFARAFFIFWHFVDVLVLSTTWNEMFCSCVDDVSIWWQMFNFVFSCPKRWFQFNSRIVRTDFSSIMSLTNWKMIAETRSHIFTWRSRFRRRRICWSSPTKTLEERRYPVVWSLPEKFSKTQNMKLPKCHPFSSYI